MKQTNMRVYRRARGASPWTVGERVRMLLWGICWALFCRWTPKPFWRWRNAWLRLFGAEIAERVFVHQRARITIPWRIRLAELSCVGDAAVLYSLDVIQLDREVTIAQEAYLCAGSHDFDDPDLPLVTAPIKVGANAFVGARAFLLPGVEIGRNAIVGACAVVTKDVPCDSVATGNPATIRPRKATCT